jgi:hypothetical protein
MAERVAPNRAILKNVVETVEAIGGFTQIWVGKHKSC